MFRLLLLLLVLPLHTSLASNCRHDCGRSQHSRCNERHCDRHCRPYAVTVTNVVTVTVRETNRVDVLARIPNLEVADFDLQPNHVYRLLFSTAHHPTWRAWGTVRSKTNQVARLLIPSRPETGLLWQFRDVTPGLGPVVLQPRPPNGEAVNYLVHRRGVLLRLNP